MEVRVKNADSILSKGEIDVFLQKEWFYQKKIDDSIFERIDKKSYRSNPFISTKELCYIQVLHYGFDHKIHVGEMIVNEKIVFDIIDIFYQLYNAAYPIEKMILVDKYDADDNRSMADNNSSCFNYRTIEGSKQLSNHSFGMAIDINPLYNPYIRFEKEKYICAPPNGIAYMDRIKKFPYKIDKQDICYQLFKKYGFEWGGDWEKIKDYQHFEKKGMEKYS